MNAFVSSITAYLEGKDVHISVTVPELPLPKEEIPGVAKVVHYGDDYGYHLGGHIRVEFGVGGYLDYPRFFSSNPRYRIVYHINPTNARDKNDDPISFSAIKTALESACTTWNTVGNASVNCTVASTSTDLFEDGTDNVSVLCFENMGLSPTAWAPTSLTSNTDESMEADIVMNSYYKWSVGDTYDGDSSTFEFRGGVTHEMGHSLGCSHPDANRITLDYYMMDARGFQWVGETWRRDLKWADMASVIHTSTAPGGSSSFSQAWSAMESSQGNDVVVSSSITVSAGDSLYIDPGTTVRFPSGTGLYVYGTLFLGNGVVLTKISGGTNWDGVSIESGGRMNVNGDITISYAANGISIYDSSGLSSGSNKITISNCTSSGVYIGYCSPTLNKLSISSVTSGYGGICVVGNTSAPVIHDSDILSSVMGIQVGNYADASAYLCDIRTNTYDCFYLGTAANLLLNGDGGYGHNTIDPANGQKAINNNSANGSIPAENNYWGETPPGSLFGDYSYVDYDPYLSSAYSGVGSGKKVLAEGGTSFISAYQLENQGRWVDAAAMYKSLLTASSSPQDKRWAIKSLLRAEDNSGKNYAAVKVLVEEELASADTKGQYRVFLEQFLCEIELRQGNIDQAIKGFISVAEKYRGTPVEVDMLARVAEVYGRQLNDKSKAKEYADKAAMVNPGQLSLYAAYKAAGTDYDPSQYEDLFASRDVNFGDQPEPLEPVSGTEEYVSVTPNPANPLTTITYSIKNPSNVRLSIYSINGQKVATLVDGPMSSGMHAVRFDGSRLASGVYLYRFESAGLKKSGRMLLLK